MSTVLVRGSPGDTLETVSSNVAAGTGMQTTSIVELQINQETTAVHDNGGTRQIQKEEVLLLLNIFEQWLVRNSWPYASS